MAGQGFTVNAPKLADGSQDVAALLDRCEVIASDAVQAIAEMPAGAGHADLAAALAGAAEQGRTAFLDFGAAFAHVAGGLAAAAGTYTRTEQDLAARAAAAGRAIR